MRTYLAVLYQFWFDELAKIAEDGLQNKCIITLTGVQSKKIRFGELPQIFDIFPDTETVIANFGTLELPSEYVIPLAAIESISDI